LHGIQGTFDLFPKRTAEEVDGDNILETLPETGDPRQLDLRKPGFEVPSLTPDSGFE
jgi:hypothetical protein